MHWLGWAALAVAASQASVFPYEAIQRDQVAGEARAYAQARRKPVLDFGCGRRPRGDVNVDIEPRQAPNFILVHSFEKSTLPFSDKHFGAAICFHVLEHVEDPEHLLTELNRVADKVFTITPSPYYIGTWLHTGHRRIYFTKDKYVENPMYGVYQASSKVLIEFPLLYPDKRMRQKCPTNPATL